MKLIEDIVHLVDFVMSCRAMGRRVEDVMFWKLMEFSKEVNAKIIKAEIIPTKKIDLLLIFLIIRILKRQKSTIMRLKLEKILRNLI